MEQSQSALPTSITFLKGEFRGPQDTGSTFQSMHGGRDVQEDLVTVGTQEEQVAWNLDVQSLIRGSQRVTVPMQEGQEFGTLFWKASS